MVTAANGAMRYRLVLPARRQALQAGQGGFKWIMFFALQAVVLLLLLQAQQEAANQRMPLLIRAGHPSDNECNCGHCRQCRLAEERECDYGR
ncbi:hypothetical protein ACFFKC_22370 [Pseudoduganella danionis]